jgi:hypothetical protein
MSTQLEKIERIASQKMVTDPVEIADLTERFLQRSLRSLVPASVKGKTYVTILSTELAKGFKCIQEEVRNCSVGDILMMFSKEEMVEFFSVPPENNREFFLNIPASAGHCLYLTGNINNYMKNDIRLKALGSIQFLAFMSFLRTALRAEYALGNLAPDDFDERTHRIGYAASEILKFCREHGFTDEKEITLWNVLGNAYKDAIKPWHCHVCELTVHADKVARAFRIMDLVFMDCIANALVLPNAERYCRGVKLSMVRPDKEEEIVMDPAKETFEQFIKRTV